jgi:hypothetical protein
MEMFSMGMFAMPSTGLLVRFIRRIDSRRRRRCGEKIGKDGENA